MCFDPVSLALALGAAGLSAFGSSISNSEDQANAEAQATARNGVLVDTMNKNNVIANDSRGTFKGNLQTYDPAAVANSQDQVTDSRSATIDGNMPGAAPEMKASPGDQRFLAEAMRTSRKSAETASGERADAAATLGGFGDLFQKLGTGTSNAANHVGTDINFATANNALLPTLQDLAAYKVYKPNSGIGSTLQGLGHAFGSYAGSL